MSEMISVVLLSYNFPRPPCGVLFDTNEMGWSQLVRCFTKFNVLLFEMFMFLIPPVDGRTDRHMEIVNWISVKKLFVFCNPESCKEAIIMLCRKLNTNQRVINVILYRKSISHIYIYIYIYSLQVYKFHYSYSIKHI
jgi:hypothetical protein